jgi:hypothetical protein
MPDTVRKPHQVFALRHVARALDGFLIPDGPFDPDGPWTATYELVERAFKLGTCGALRLERVPDATGTARLRFRFRKQSGGGVMWAAGEIRQAVDALGSPLAWSSETWVTSRDGREVDGTRWSEQVEVGEGTLRRLGVGLAPRLTAFIGPLATEWGLFEAVQRLARTPGGEWHFSLADRLGTCVKPGQVLTVGPSLTVSLGGQRVWGEEAQALAVGTVYRPLERTEGATDVRLQGYEQTGQGILPTTYWLDDAGRLLFVLSGMTGWILKPQASV